MIVDVGVFVDSQGNRTRDEDIQWSGLPLAFGKFYLYSWSHFSYIVVVRSSFSKTAVITFHIYLFVAYRSPYLYVVYYKAMQVIGPLEQTGCNW